MTPQSKLWIQAYQEITGKWNLEPDWRLIKYANFLSGRSVLDIGMGNGRNAIFFAKMGFDVDCIDVSTTYVRRCKQLAQAEGLPLNAQLADIRSFEIPKHRYALIIISKMLHFFRKSEIEAIAEKISMGLARRGLAYVKMFSLKEFEHIRNSSNFKLVEPNTYYHRKYHLYNHFFTVDEVVSLFSRLKIKYCVEGFEMPLKYKKSRYQYIIEYVGQRIR
jgi:cyclopropane fatty-acyl-phospholipid synthase-like methyltransferase